VVAQLDAQGVEQLARQHSLVVVSTGRAGVPSLFPRRPELSPYSTPQRLLFAALFRGIRPPEPLGMHINVSPGHGEIFESRLVTFQGPTGSLLIEALPGGALAELSTRSWEDKPRELTARLLELLPEHAPATFERVVPEEFELLGPMDWLSGTVTPVVRRGYAALGEGRFVLALGDAHVTNDPVSGLGANAASASAWALGGHILETLKAGRGFDEAFCQEAERRTWAAAEPATHWSNAQLQPPPPHVGMAMFAASQDQALADALINTMVLPEKILAAFATPESAEAFVAKHRAAGGGAGAR
jgi:2-polyprenyl-6-methoxyphenol hydroxylase-like FAD-dependent oxidoreductase